MGPTEESVPSVVALLKWVEGWLSRRNSKMSHNDLRQAGPMLSAKTVDATLFLQSIGRYKLLVIA